MHDDHAGGLFDILDRFPVGRLVLSGFFYSDSEYLYFLSRLTPYGIPYFFPRRGERLDWGPDVGVEVLNPPELFYTGSSSDDNLNSLVIRLTYGGNSLLLAGDVEETAERNIADAFPGRVDVLKVAHHGGAGSSSQFFLDVYRPRISVICVGRDNDYGHPSPSTLSRLERYSRVYRTDINGTVTLRMNGRDIDVSSER
jgi:beta-lactamase superfamily II metal-dependent hydrolase